MKPPIETIIIYGAGRFGTCAGKYYGKKRVLCYVDKDAKKWGKTIDGIKIYSPDALIGYTGHVVVAVQSSALSIIDELFAEYSVTSISVFGIQEVPIFRSKETQFDPLNSIAMHFAGGLGNQMFQCALYFALRENGKKVYVVRDNKIDTPSFILDEVFRDIEMEFISYSDEEKIIHGITCDNQFEGVYSIYHEKMQEGITKKASSFLLEIDAGVISGIHQTSIFADAIRNYLLSSFLFNEKKVRDNLRISWPFNNIRRCVSVHIRRGDYLTSQNVRLYGDICTEEYYRRAIEVVKEKSPDILICFFSNDIEWVKEKYAYENAIYFCDELFDEYDDWYDMFLMSQCDHNIIANSSFSWWGAWLNQNEDKTVIAPAKWINIYNYEDIYPDTWIRIDENGNINGK